MKSIIDTFRQKNLSGGISFLFKLIFFVIMLSPAAILPDIDNEFNDGKNQIEFSSAAISVSAREVKQASESSFSFIFPQSEFGSFTNAATPVKDYHNILKDRAPPLSI